MKRLCRQLSRLRYLYFVERADAAKLIQQETGMDAETVSSTILTIRNTIEERKLYSFLGPLGIHIHMLQNL